MKAKDNREEKEGEGEGIKDERTELKTLFLLLYKSRETV